LICRRGKYPLNKRGQCRKNNRYCIFWLINCEIVCLFPNMRGRWIFPWIYLRWDLSFQLWFGESIYLGWVCGRGEVDWFLWWMTNNMKMFLLSWGVWLRSTPLKKVISRIFEITIHMNHWVVAFECWVELFKRNSNGTLMFDHVSYHWKSQKPIWLSPISLWLFDTLSLYIQWVGVGGSYKCFYWCLSYCFK